MNLNAIIQTEKSNALAIIILLFLKLKTYKCQRKRQSHDLNFEFVDTMGIENQGGGMLPEDFEKVLDGHVPDRYNVSMFVMHK